MTRGVALTVYISAALSSALDKERERRGEKSKPKAARAILEEYLGLTDSENERS